MTDKHKRLIIFCLVISCIQFIICGVMAKVNMINEIPSISCVVLVFFPLTILHIKMAVDEFKIKRILVD